MKNVNMKVTFLHTHLHVLRHIQNLMNWNLQLDLSSVSVCFLFTTDWDSLGVSSFYTCWPTPVFIYTVLSRCAGIIQVMFTPTGTSSTPPPPNTHMHAYPSLLAGISCVYPTDAWQRGPSWPLSVTLPVLRLRVALDLLFVVSSLLLGFKLFFKVSECTIQENGQVNVDDVNAKQYLYMVPVLCSTVTWDYLL